MSDRRVVILAGGKGTRLKPYTISIPKPLVPIGDKPILEIIINQLKKAGFTHITISLNHMAELIKTFFGDGSKWGITIDYSVESIPLSTMGPLKLIKNLPENFLVLNGDVFTDLDFSKLYDYHVSAKNLFTISTINREEKIDYGVLDIENSTLIGFREKPIFTFNVSMGIYVVNKKILDFIPENIAFGFDDLMKSLIIKKKPADLFMFKGFWLDIGRPEDYEKAILELPRFNL
ncbi:MAG: sugar phosphate nucleotidyltransferase [Ignavibacteriaceae bacterium]|jgi:NDP-sugar pyrophosphorylase family protein